MQPKKAASESHLIDSLRIQRILSRSRDWAGRVILVDRAVGQNLMIDLESADKD
jgi:hypothetical protein